jgi:APA family basic amino acid/polyamine antiporter
MGGIIGSGIFATPATVARAVHSPALVLAAWGAGGVIALAGAFIYAELASRRPDVGGQYAYLRDGFHPVVAFVYGWALLLVIQTGGMAAVAVIFATYFLQLVPLQLSPQVVAVAAVAILVLINCLGVRAGSSVQNGFMLLKLAAIFALVFTGIFLARSAGVLPTESVSPAADAGAASLGAAMTPVMFAYGGWQSASFISGEMRNPRRDLARGVVLGVAGVIVLYLAVNVAFLRGLGQAGLEGTSTPATEVMRATFGEGGARFIAAGITISTLGFLSQGMLTAPRVYFAMAQDGLFFRSVARLHPTSKAPVVAIVLQGVLTIIIALSGRFDQILSYVVSVDFIFFGLTAATVFVFRSRSAPERRAVSKADASALPRGTQPFSIPLHPVTTAVFILASAAIVVSTLVARPGDSAIGVAIMLAGIPVYYLWRSSNRGTR